MNEEMRTVPRTMAALRVFAFGEAPRLGQVPVPEPGPKDVLVELAASVVSHHDLTVARGDFSLRPDLPYIPGLEGAGRVVRVGAEVDPARIRPGMSVRVYGGGLGATRPGTWAEYAAVTARAVTPVPETLDLPLAAACGSVAATAWTAAIDLGALQTGERLGVTGASGAVGSLVLQLAARHGARSSVGWVRSPEKAGFLPAGVEAAGRKPATRSSRSTSSSTRSAARSSPSACAPSVRVGVRCSWATRRAPRCASLSRTSWRPTWRSFRST